MIEGSTAGDYRGITNKVCCVEVEHVSAITVTIQGRVWIAHLFTIDSALCDESAFLCICLKSLLQVSSSIAHYKIIPWHTEE